MIRTLAPIEPVDYLIMGHITQDRTPSGVVLGGTATYAALTASALGLKVGIVTSWPDELPLPEWPGINIAVSPSEFATTFENIHTPEGRIQYLHHRAETLDMSQVPETWKYTPIVHLGPVAGEIDPRTAHQFTNAFLGVTPQGWMRQWDSRGRVTFGDWPEAAYVLEQTDAAIISIEDVQGDEQVIEDMATESRLLVVTEGAQGARIYWNGDVRRISPPMVVERDPLGAGDIFAAAFFVRMAQTRDPWEAARCANYLAAQSVTRSGMLSIPTQEEIQNSLVQVIE
jgi:sugar/nucleoside kinase (ribokinase family)